MRTLTRSWPPPHLPCNRGSLTQSCLKVCFVLSSRALLSSPPPSLIPPSPALPKLLPTSLPRALLLNSRRLAKASSARVASVTNVRRLCLLVCLRMLPAGGPGRTTSVVALEWTSSIGLLQESGFVGPLGCVVSGGTVGSLTLTEVAGHVLSIGVAKQTGSHSEVEQIGLAGLVDLTSGSGGRCGFAANSCLECGSN